MTRATLCALRAEAGNAGDLAIVHACETAMGLRGGSMSRARRLCARVISAARAMLDADDADPGGRLGIRVD